MSMIFVTTPDGVILNTLWLALPATKTLPWESAAIPSGWRSGLPRLSPSTLIIWVICPDGVTRNTLLLSCPDTKRLPKRSTATRWRPG
jgi:hypothetical protein